MHFWHNSGFSLLALKIYVWRNKTLRINKETALAQNDNLPTEMVLAAYARSLIFVYIRIVAAWQQVVRASISI